MCVEYLFWRVLLVLQQDGESAQDVRVCWHATLLLRVRRL